MQQRIGSGDGAEFVDPEPKPGAVGKVAFLLPEVARGVLVELNEPDRAAEGR